MKRTSSESGSVLTYILIAVVLFGALSFTVARIMRGGSASPQKEVQQVNASEILQYATALRQAAQTVQQINGFSSTQLSFETPVLAGYALACPDGSDKCKIFNPDGGGLSYQTPDNRWLDDSGSGGGWLFSGSNEVVGVGTDGGAGDSSVELLAVLPWIKKDLCLKLNDMLGVTNPAGNPPADSGNINLIAKFTGTYDSDETIGGGDPEIEGQRAGCVEGAGTPPAGSYHFFQVLMAR